MNKLKIWSPKEAQQTLAQRLQDAKQDRDMLERRWQQNERTVFTTDGSTNDNLNLSISMDSTYSGVDGIDQGVGSVGINYAFKNYRFLHAQLSSNPPSVTPHPSSNDPEDRRAADAADRLLRYALREYKMQEVVDRASANCLLYGTGFTKTIWDTTIGDPIEWDEETGEYVMEGDFHITVPNVWNIFIDPDANSWDEVRYVFEKIIVSWEEAAFRFPDKVEILQKYRQAQLDTSNYGNATGRSGGNASLLKSTKYDVVELYEYWEKGSPMNGFVGRFCICTDQGQLITELMENPEQYAPPKKSGKTRLPQAFLPYQIFTDIDVPNQVWGKSFVEYTAALQENLNRLDNVTLETANAHGVPRIILPEGCEIADDSITNSPWDIIKITGTQPPHFMNPMDMPSVVPQLLERYRAGIDDMSGVNENMFGQQSREQSALSMQYATNNGNMIRRRLFNKYVLFVENIYNSYLRILQNHWEVSRTIEVLGKEKAFEASDIKGADIDGGFALVVQYGNTLSLDPVTRRDEILTLIPLFEKAGVESRQLLSMLELNELSNMYDVLDLAEDRQREIFEEMIQTGIYIAPEELQDHQNMLKYAYYYLMTSEFKYLKDDSKVLIKRHVKEREELAAQGAQTPQMAPPPLGGLPPGPLPGGPAGPAPVV